MQPIHAARAAAHQLRPRPLPRHTLGTVRLGEGGTSSLALPWGRFPTGLPTQQRALDPPRLQEHFPQHRPRPFPGDRTARVAQPRPVGLQAEGSCQALKLMVASAGIPGNNQSDWLFSYLVIQSPSRLSLGPSRRSPDVECVARAQTICVDGLIQAGAHLVQTESKMAD